MRKDLIQQIINRIDTDLTSIPNEATTITSLVHPFFSAMGYDVGNSKEFISEYASDFTKRGDCADCAILRNGKPIIIIECKACTRKLSTENEAQLRKYFSVHATAKLGILTNGIEYRFFTDSGNKNIMDTSPFLTFSLSQPDSVPYKALMLFSKSNYTDNVLSRISVIQRIKKDMQKELKHPSAELARIILSQVDLSPAESIPSSPKIDTQKNSKHAESSLKLVREILSDIISPVRLNIHSDLVHWCSIAIDNLGNVLEIKFNEKTGNKWLLMNILDGVKYPITELADVSSYSAQIHQAAKLILAKKTKK